MKLIHSWPDRILIYHLKNILESQDIDCSIRNEFLGGGAGDIPATETWPELWINKDQDFVQARTILDAYLNLDEQTKHPWTCTTCGESIEFQFTQCWACGEKKETDT